MTDFAKQLKFEKHNHHYVPQFWQKQFRDSSNRLFKTHRGGTKTASTKTTMSADWVYTSFDDGWRPSDSVEDYLGSWETAAAEIIGDIGSTATVPSEEKWAFLALWLGICACRHPNILKRYKELSTQYAYSLAEASDYQNVNDMNQILHARYGVTIDKADFERLKETSLEDLIHQANHIENIPPYHPDLPSTEALLAQHIVAKSIYNLDLDIIDVPDGCEFLLGSNPLSNESLSHGFTVPLSRHMALKARPPRIPMDRRRERRTASIFEVGEVNVEQIGRSNEAIASNREILEYWVRVSDRL